MLPLFSVLSTYVKTLRLISSMRFDTYLDDVDINGIDVDHNGHECVRDLRLHIQNRSSLFWCCFLNETRYKCTLKPLLKHRYRLSVAAAIQATGSLALLA